MLFGNDFLPKLSFLHFNNDVYDFLYKSYEQCCVETKTRIVVYNEIEKKYEIDYYFLKSFFRLLMSEENVRY